MPHPEIFRIVPYNPICLADQKKHIQMSHCERSQHIFPSKPLAAPNKKIKLMVESEVNDETSDEDSDNEQL